MFWLAPINASKRWKWLLWCTSVKICHWGKIFRTKFIGMYKSVTSKDFIPDPDMLFVFMSFSDVSDVWLTIQTIFKGFQQMEAEHCDRLSCKSTVCSAINFAVSKKLKSRANSSAKNVLKRPISLFQWECLGWGVRE